MEPEGRPDAWSNMVKNTLVRISLLNFCVCVVWAKIVGCFHGFLHQGWRAGLRSVELEGGWGLGRSFDQFVAANYDMYKNTMVIFSSPGFMIACCGEG